MNLEFVKNVDTFRIEKIRENFEWFYSNYEFFRKYYPGKHIAIKDEKVIGYDKNLETLLERLQVKDYSDSIAIEFVYP
ncbi:MAG TPA: DUF5678 domain-containing protein [Candidatus Nitrosocosmicus sp.]|jgi:hypothetical protein|nr:DUF5678 domain-containing protein [Candidatus Nitrosocosmicus sp.]